MNHELKNKMTLEVKNFRDKIEKLEKTEILDNAFEYMFRVGAATVISSEYITLTEDQKSAILGYTNFLDNLYSFSLEEEYTPNLEGYESLIKEFLDLEN
jgi:hypothetical protein